MSSIRLKLSPPWVTYANEIIKLFGEDPDIKIDYNSGDESLKLFVENDKKAALLLKILPYAKTFGNVTLGIEVIPANKKRFDYNFGDDITVKEAFDILFEKNPIYKFSYEVNGIFSNTIVYVVFAKEVVQFFNDNLHDIYGNVSTLYQNIAEDVFEDCTYYLQNVFFCTDAEPAVGGAPLGEWP